VPRANDLVEAALLEYADLLSILSSDPFKPRSYEKAARAVGFPADVSTLDLKGISRSLGGQVDREKIHSSWRPGRSPPSTIAQIPSGMRQMMAIPGLGPKKAMVLYTELEISSVDELQHAVEAHELADLKGFGEKTEENIRKGIVRLHESSERVMVNVALELAEELLGELGALKGVQRCAYAGSLRRMAETIGDVDLLVAAREEDAPAIMDAFVGFGAVDRVLAHGDTKSSIVTKGGLQVDLRVVIPDVWGAAMIYFTGSKAHNIRIREMAVRKGLKLSEYGLFRAKSGMLVVAETEEDVYAQLGLPWIAPTLREDRGEVDAALADDLPDVVQLKHIRGDLHTHTNLTDGLAPLER
jgi:DNA polymerase (family 10)